MDKKQDNNNYMGINAVDQVAIQLTNEQKNYSNKQLYEMMRSFKEWSSCIAQLDTIFVKLIMDTFNGQDAFLESFKKHLGFPKHNSGAKEDNGSLEGVRTAITKRTFSLKYHFDIAPALKKVIQELGTDRIKYDKENILRLYNYIFKTFAIVDKMIRCVYTIYLARPKCIKRLKTYENESINAFLKEYDLFCKKLNKLTTYDFYFWQYYRRSNLNKDIIQFLDQWGIEDFQVWIYFKIALSNKNQFKFLEQMYSRLHEKQKDN